MISQYQQLFDKYQITLIIGVGDEKNSETYFWTALVARVEKILEYNI